MFPNSLLPTQTERVNRARGDVAMGMPCLFESEVAPRKRKSREPVKDEKAIAQLLGLLGLSRIANNLNLFDFLLTNNVDQFS